MLRSCSDQAKSVVNRSDLQRAWPAPASSRQAAGTRRSRFGLRGQIKIVVAEDHVRAVQRQLDQARQRSGGEFDTSIGRLQLRRIAAARRIGQREMLGRNEGRQFAVRCADRSCHNSATKIKSRRLSSETRSAKSSVQHMTSTPAAPLARAPRPKSARRRSGFQRPTHVAFPAVAQIAGHVDALCWAVRLRSTTSAARKSGARHSAALSSGRSNRGSTRTRPASSR